MKRKFVLFSHPRRCAAGTHLLKKNLVHIVLQTWPAESLERGGVDVDA